MADRRPIQVAMCESTASVPTEILETVQKHMEDMSRALAELEPENPFWDSLRDSGLSVHVLGWRFRFTVEPGKLVLTEADPVPPQAM